MPDPPADRLMARQDGAAVYCPVCEAKFGGMTTCPWDGATLLPLPDADPTAGAFYRAIGVRVPTDAAGPPATLEPPCSASSGVRALPRVGEQSEGAA